MADNFNLRQFLTENRLTNNAKLLKEADETREAYALVIDKDGYFMQEDLATYAQESYLDSEGEQLQGAQEVLNYPNTVHAWQHAPEQEKSQNEEWKAAVTELGDSYTYYDVIGDGGENAVIAAIPQGSSLTDYIKDGDEFEDDEDSLEEGREIGSHTPYDALMDEVGSIWGESEKHSEYQTAIDKAYKKGLELKTAIDNAHEKGLEPKTAIDNAYEEGVIIDPEGLENYTRDELNKWAEDQIIAFGEKEGWYEDPNRTMEEAAPALNKTMSALKDKYRGDIMDNKLGQKSLNAALEKDAEYNKLQPSEQRKLKTYLQGILNAEYNESKQPVTESKLTAKERRLVEMVQNALGVPPQVAEEDIVEEKPLPKYESIEQLMKEIEQRTYLVAEKHKIQEMKRIAERLRAEAKKMEESEHVQHINPKVLKKYVTDAGKIERAAEKLKARLEKASTGNRKPAAKEEEQTVEALQEGTFDLRKYLVENKLTATSRIVNENSTPDVEEIVGWVLEQPVYEDLSPKQLGAMAQEYLEEWEASKGNFNSLEEYLATVEENGDFL